MKIKSKVRGAIIGTAIGDALGMPVEGLKPETIKERYGKITKFIDSQQSIHRTLKKGQWTDDTVMMMSMIKSLINGYINFEQIAKNHVKYFKAFQNRGFGRSTRVSLNKISDGAYWWSAGKKDGAGNGVVMKMAPLGIAHYLGMINIYDLISSIINISRMTHGDSRAAIAAILQAQAVSIALSGGIFALRNFILNSVIYTQQLENILGSKTPKISESLNLGLENIEHESLIGLRNIIGNGCFVVESFPFSFISILKFYKNPINLLIDVVNAGGDADTTGALVGMLIGASFGLTVFPYRFRKKLENYKNLIKMSDQMFKLGDINAAL